MTEALPQFQYLEPSTVADAVKALQSDPTAVLCAGGTDLVVRLRKGLSEAGSVIHLGKIDILNTIEVSESGMRIGAGVTLAEVARNSSIGANYPAIAKAPNASPGRATAKSQPWVAISASTLAASTTIKVTGGENPMTSASNTGGDTCHVAPPQGNRCRAAYSGDMAPPR